MRSLRRTSARLARNSSPGFRAGASAGCWTWAAERAASAARCATESTSWPESSSSPSSQRKRARVYDQVLTGKVEDVIDDLDGPFDTILAYDLLEHLVRARGRAATPARRRRGGRPAPRLRSERSALVAPSRSRRARHVRLHRLGAPRPNAPALADALGPRRRCSSRPAGASRDRRTQPSRRRAASPSARPRGLSAEFLVYQWSALARRATPS